MERMMRKKGVSEPESRKSFDRTLRHITTALKGCWGDCSIPYGIAGRGREAQVACHALRSFLRVAFSVWKQKI